METRYKKHKKNVLENPKGNNDQTTTPQRVPMMSLSYAHVTNNGIIPQKYDLCNSVK